MSTDPKRPYSQMLSVAKKIIERLTPACQRIEIAGSLRRKKDMIGDIEIIAVPIHCLNLFGEPTGETEIDYLVKSWPVELHKDGKKYKSFSFAGSHGNTYKVDLFLQPDPATWGINYMIRTGSALFSRQMVTKQMSGGFMPNGFHVQDARLWSGSELLETPEEANVFELYGMDYIEPEMRL